MNISMQSPGNEGRKSFFIVWIRYNALLPLNGCAPAISPEIRKQVNPDLNYSALAAHPEKVKGQVVLLGGTIVQAIPKPGRTDIEVVQKDLHSSGEPRLTDQSEGRFLVVVDRFLDPAIYSPGRGLTVAGKVQGSVLRPIGESDYRYPVIAAVELHLWRDPVAPPAYPYYSPYGYPYDPWRWWR